jgi:hypothetical protein
MKRKPRKEKRNSVKSILRLPDLEAAKSAVLNSLSCPDARRGYPFFKVAHHQTLGGLKSQPLTTVVNYCTIPHQGDSPMKDRIWDGLIRKRIAQHFRQFHTQGARGVGRREFFNSAGVAGLALGSGLWVPNRANAQPGTARPNPIPGGATPLGILVHHYPLPTNAPPLAQINDPSEITDFNGVIGDTQIRGGGTGTGFTQTLAYRADMGFMQGEYVGEDGNHHHGTFVFV